MKHLPTCISCDQDSVSISPSLYTFEIGFFLSLGLWPPFLRAFVLGNLLIINYFSVNLRCKSFKKFLPVLQSWPVFLKDTRVISLKSNDQGTYAPISHSLWEGRSLISEDSLFQVVKLTPIMKVQENLVFLRARTITKHRCPMISHPQLLKTL